MSRKAKDQPDFKLWKKIGDLTYELVDPKTKTRYIGTAENELTEAQLNFHLTLCVLLHNKPLKPGEKFEFGEIWQPMDVVNAVMKCPATVPETKLALTSVLNSAESITLEQLNEVFRIINPWRKAPAPKGVCPDCYGRGWVCEDHPDMPIGCPCLAPGMACERCNKKEAIILGPGDFIISGDSCPNCYDRRWLCAKHKKPWGIPDIGCSCAKGKPCPECNQFGNLQPGERAGTNLN